MNIIAIKTFLAVVRIGNLNRAADEMNITQSAVTARLDALDQALGARLLNRSRKGATLTKAGYVFLEQAEVISRMWDTARTRISLPKRVKRLFSVVCGPTLWGGMGQVWLDDLKTTQTDTAFEIWTASALDAQKWLISGISDAALLPEPISSAGIASRLFANEPLVQVSTQNRPAVQWDPNYIYVDYGPDFRTRHAETWHADETAGMTFSNPEWALQHILSQGGSAYLPQGMSAPLIAENRLYPVPESPEFERAIYLSWRVDSEDMFNWLRTPKEPLRSR